MELTNEQKKKGIWLEIKDLFTGAAFPVMLQLILSASIILFVDALSEDTALQIVVLVIGELLFMGAYTIFGRQNGITAYRRTVQNAKKRELQADDLTCWLKTGDYAVWKGIVIGLITVIPFMFVQFIHCVAPNLVCEFILKYAFGWAAYPFIVIGQAAEFDYAGAQACRVLKDAGINVVLCNSNPATIMTDKALADEIYLEPLTVDTLKRIIIKERPDSLLASLGGQTGLTLGCQLAKSGFLDEYGVKLIGVNLESIDRAEDREIGRAHV